MTVLQDGFVPQREALSQVEQIRSGDTRGSLTDHAPDLTPVRGTHELHEQLPLPDTEPHGMYWARNAQGNLYLRPHDWYVRFIAVQADDIFMMTREAADKDEVTKKLIRVTGRAFKRYIDCRATINDMVVKRKLRQELDDAAYQFCQAAKYRSDAEEKARFLVERDGDILDNEQISALVERARQAAHEGYVVAYALQSIDYTEPMNFQASAKRVIEYSCRKLTEWYATRRQNQEGQRKASNAAGMAIINNLFARARK